MKILITGGAGFIGYHLSLKLAKEGNKVVIIDNYSRGVKDTFLQSLIKEYDVELRKYDLIDRTLVDEIEHDFDYIYHLAAIIGVQNVLNHSYDVLTNNVLLTMNVIDLARKQDHLKRLLFASTSEVYAGTLRYYGLKFPTTEDTPLTVSEIRHPRTSYMLSKIYGEALLQQSDVSFTIFRPHNFYGPRMGMAHVIPELLRKAYMDENNGKLSVYSANHMRTFCYIDDAVELITRLANIDSAEGEEFNIGNEKPEVTMREVGEIVLNTVGRGLEIELLPASPGSPERRCPSMKKTIEYTKYEPHVSLDDGIARTFNWYKEYIFEGKEICEK